MLRKSKKKKNQQQKHWNKYRDLKQFIFTQMKTKIQAVVDAWVGDTRCWELQLCWISLRSGGPSAVITPWTGSSCETPAAAEAPSITPQAFVAGAPLVTHSPVKVSCNCYCLLFQRYHLRGCYRSIYSKVWQWWTLVAVKDSRYGERLMLGGAVEWESFNK